jgi:DNA repair protein RecN (Recombination protein N)
MLRRLHIQNLPLLRDIALTWDLHLNILTGETGAGKSLLVEALATLLGAKADLPNPASRAVIEAEFDPVPQAVHDLLEEPLTPPLLLRCEISPQGRRRYFLNDALLSAQQVREIAYHLLEIHSQHETQALFRPAYQMRLLDAYAELHDELAAYRKHYHEWRHLADEVQQLQTATEARQQRRAWLENQLAQVPPNLSAENYAQLETQMRRIEHQNLFVTTLSQWLHQLSEAPHNPISLLSQAVKALQRLPEGETTLTDATTLLESARYNIQEAADLLSRLLDAYTLNPHDIETIQSQYDLYNHLMHRFQVPTVELLIETIQRYQAELAALQAEENALEPAQQKLQALTQQLLDAAYRLELARLAAAQNLSDEVEAYIAELGLQGARFQISVERLTSPRSPLRWYDQPVEVTPDGFNQVTFLIQTNPGFPMAPLSQVASGGEMSRIMLALKAALAKKMSLPTLILDEIDTGLSGETAQRMGAFLSRLAQRLQIILITHLPAIAAQPGTHFYIAKQPTTDGSTETRIRQLTPSERIAEIARLLSGNPDDPAARLAAQNLLTTAGAL